MTKELKKKHSSRPVGGSDTGSRGREDTLQGASLQSGQPRRQLVDWALPHLCADKPGGKTGERDRQSNPDCHRGEIKSQNPWL